MLCSFIATLQNVNYLIYAIYWHCCKYTIIHRQANVNRAITIINKHKNKTKGLKIKKQKTKQNKAKQNKAKQKTKKQNNSKNKFKHL